MTYEYKIGANLLRKEANYKACFHADSSCSGDIIRAHSISNSRVLRRISVKDAGDVLYMDLVERAGGTTYVMGDTGRGKATVFSGFCAKHDMEIFQDIDDQDFIQGNEKQAFLFAYRTLAKEYHSKQTAIAMNGRLISLMQTRNIGEMRRYSPGYNGNNDGLPYLVEMQRRALVSLAELEGLRQSMNKNLDRLRFWKLKTWVVQLNKEYPIAVSTVVKGGMNFHARHATEPMPAAPACSLINLFPQDGKTLVLFSVPKKFSWFFGFYDEFAALSDRRKKLVLSDIIVRYAENIVLGKSYWNKFPEQWRNRFNHEWESTTVPYSRTQAEITNDTLNIFADH